MPPTATKAEPTAKDDSAEVKSEKTPGLYVIIHQPREGAQLVELHTDETAEARVSALTFASKQHRREMDDAETPIPDDAGGGSHEINRRDIKVYKLGTTEVTDF